ncbi:MAG: hypothetical protein P8Y02_03190 [Deinococcales bacterium]
MSTSRFSAGLAFAVLALALAACSSSTPSGSPPSGGTSNGTTVQVTTGGTVPWLAAQDGAGAWTRLSGSSFTVTNSAGKYGLAWVCTLGSGQAEVQVAQATTSDSTSVTASCQANPAPATGSVSGVITGIPSGGFASVSIGGQIKGVSTSGTQATFSLQGIPTGTQTIIAFGVTSGNLLASVYVRRNVTVNSGTNSGITVDLASTTYATTQGLSTKVLSVTGVPSNETSGVASAYVTGAATANVLSMMLAMPSVNYIPIPPTLANSSDTYAFTADAHTSGFGTGSGGDDQRTLFVSQQPGATTNVSVPGVLPSTAGIGVSGGTAVATWGSPSFSTSGGTTAFIASVTPSAPSPIWHVDVSSTWLGSASSYTFPDFAATSGWNTTWDFPTGVTADAWVEAAHANLTIDQLLTAVKTDGYPTSYPNGTSIELTQRLATNGTY